MPGFGTTELIIVLVIVLLLFGVGRISKIAGEIGSGIHSFRQGLGGNTGGKTQTPEKNKE